MAIAETQVYMPQAPRPKVRLMEDERCAEADGGSNRRAQCASQMISMFAPIQAGTGKHAPPVPQLTFVYAPCRQPARTLFGQQIRLVTERKQPFI